MTTSEAIDFYGGVQKLADALGVRRQSVWKWGDRPPKGRQYELQAITGGALKADPDEDRKAA